MNFRSLIVISLIGLSLAACNAGSSLPASNSATPAPSASPSSTSQTYTNLSSGSQQTLSALNGVTPTVTLPTLSSPFSGAVTESSTVPSTVTTFSNGAPNVRNLKSTVANSSALLFIAFSPTTTTTATGTLSTSFTLSSTPSSGVNYYIAFFNGTSWDATDYTTPGTISGNTISFTGSLPAAGLTLSANTSYAIVLYSVPTSSSTLTAGSTVSGTFLDGTTASLTLPTVSGATTGNYTAIGSASALPVGTQLPTTGTFVGGITATSASAFSLPGGTALTYTITPSTAPYGQNLILYYVTTTGAPVTVATQSVSSTATINGTITVPATVNVVTGSSYSFVAYEQ